jgi:ABC-2 type transport system permease protein
MTQAPESSDQPDFVVTLVTDFAVAREDVVDGEYAALLAVERSPGGELDFTLYTNDVKMSGTPARVRQASTSIAIADRLDRLGVAAADQATLFSPARFDVEWPDPGKTDPIGDTTAMIGQDMLSFGLTVLIFMIIIMYGTWIAMSVVEEKSSRVMEVVLNAATPFQLLTGKVIGVGAVALTQYAAIVLVGSVALLVQNPVASAVLGEAGTATALPEGLTLALLLVFGVYGILGFLLYEALYAAAGSLVSRQEDVNTVILPMTLLSTGGYLVGIYSAIGLLDIKAGWIVVLSQIPLFSPFMMLGRFATNEAAPWEFIVSVGLLLVFIAGALWLAARIYAAGVLLYGQRPGLRAIVRLVRVGM